MMTVQQVMNEVRRLSFADKLALLELLTRALRDEQQAKSPADSSASRVRGLLKPDQPPPADAELADDYTRYLIEKYT